MQWTTFNADVELEDVGGRIDQWLASKLSDVSRSRIKKLIVDGHVTVNGQQVVKVSYCLKAADLIELSLQAVEPQALKPIDLNLDIIFEDNDLIVVHKRAGLVVHPGAGTKEPTLIEGILFHTAVNGGEQSIRPGIVHRLDKDTSGVMVIAKNELAHRKLAEQFAAKSNDREYVALLDGCIRSDQVEVESYLHRDPEHRLRFASMPVDEYTRRFGTEPRSSHKWAKTSFTRKADFGGRLTLCFVKLFTGRTHQIRVHAKSLEAAVLGDQLYNKSTTLPSSFNSEIVNFVKKIDRQMLHARLLGFTHPTTQQWVSFEAPLPEDFKALLSLLKPYAS